MPEARCAIVTGASRGIGRAVALRLAADGYDIAACSSAPGEAADKARAEIEATGRRCWFEPCDVRDGDAVERFVKGAHEALGPACALVNNAGITRDAPLVMMRDEAWSDVVDTNLTGTWSLCRALVYRFMKQRGGAIVNLSSVAGVYGNAGQTNYAATKAGIIGLSRSLAKEVASYGIRVNVVAPGFVDTDMTAGLSEGQREKARTMIPLGRYGRAEEVAAAVSFLVSDEAGYITGQVLQVDGGIVL